MISHPNLALRAVVVALLLATFINAGSFPHPTIRVAHAAETWNVDPANPPGQCQAPERLCLGIQEAVSSAADGDVVTIAASTFTEQIIISKTLSISGAGASLTTIKAPASLVTATYLPPGNEHRAIVEIGNAVTVTLANLRVAGPVDLGCGQIDSGVLVDGNARALLNGVAVSDIRSSQVMTCPAGSGIVVGSSSDGASGSLVATGLTVTGFQRSGIVIDGLGSSAALTETSVSGGGLGAGGAQRGVLVSSGATAKLLGVTTTNHQCGHPSCGPEVMPNKQAFGVLLLQSGPVTMTGSTARDNDTGIGMYLVTGTVPLSGNWLAANRYNGVLISESSSGVYSSTVEGGTTGLLVPISPGDTVSPSLWISGSNVLAPTSGIHLTDNNPGDTTMPQASGIANNFTGQPTVAIRNESELTVTMPSSWWGCLVGPPGPGCGLTTGPVITEPIAPVPMLSNRYVTTTGIDAGNCADPNAPCRTLAYAHDRAFDGEVVKVAAGSYAEPPVPVSKRLSFQGAQAGIDARGRTGAESVLAGPLGALYVLTSAVTLDGFTVQGVVSPSFGAAIVISPTTSGHVIANTIVQSSTVGIELNGTGIGETVVRYNVFQHNQPGGAIVSTAGVHRATISQNRFAGNQADSIRLTPSAPYTSTMVGISGNVFDASGSILLAATSVLTINGNVISGSLGSGISLAGDVSDGILTDNQFVSSVSSALLSEPRPGSTGTVRGPNRNLVISRNTVVADVGIAAPPRSLMVVSGTIGTSLVASNTMTMVGSPISLTGPITALVVAGQLPGNLIVHNNELTGSLAITTTAFQIVGPLTSSLHTIVRNNIVTGFQRGLIVAGLVSGSRLTVTENALIGTPAALDGGESGQVSAAGNWWGSISGPANPLNPGGSGGAVTGIAGFSPWLADGTDTLATIGFQPNLSPTYGIAQRIRFADAQGNPAQPGGGPLGSPITPQPRLRVEDTSGALAINFARPVTFSIGSAPGGAGGDVLTGTLVVTSASGLGAASNLSLRHAGADYTMVATTLGATGPISVTSDPFSISRATQVISLTTVPTRTLWIDPPAPVTATTSSGLPALLSAGPAGICAMNGALVTLLGLGICQIQASQPGNADYFPAGPVTATITITGPTPAIGSISPPTISAGSPALTITVTGLNFVPGRTSLLWSTTILSTTVISPTVLIAVVPAPLLVTGGQVAVSVGIEGAGTSPSNPVLVQIATPTPTPTATPTPSPTPRPRSHTIAIPGSRT